MPADTYNPNELFKLKHGYILANQIAQAINGVQRTTRPITSLKYYAIVNSAATYVNVPADGVINMSTANIAINSLRIMIDTPFDGTCPTIVDFVDNAANKLKLTDITYFGETGFADRVGLWQIRWQIDNTASTAIPPRTVSFILHFNSTTQYDAYDKEITFNVAEPT